MWKAFRILFSFLIFASGVLLTYLLATLALSLQYNFIELVILNQEEMPFFSSYMWAPMKLFDKILVAEWEVRLKEVKIKKDLLCFEV